MPENWIGGGGGLLLGGTIIKILQAYRAVFVIGLPDVAIIFPKPFPVGKHGFIWPSDVRHGG